MLVDQLILLCSIVTKVIKEKIWIWNTGNKLWIWITISFLVFTITVAVAGISLEKGFIYIYIFMECCTYLIIIVYGTTGDLASVEILMSLILLILYRILHAARRRRNLKEVEKEKIKKLIKEKGKGIKLIEIGLF